MDKTSFGVIGLGVMGKSICLNIAEKGIPIAAYNRITKGEEHVVNDFLEENKNFTNLKAFTDLNGFINSLERPRKILLMIKAGKTVDTVIEQLIPLLNEDDIIIDGGNSHYLDTERRTCYLQNKSILFFGAGISGGEEGARKGPSIMPGGSKDDYNLIAPIFESIAARDKDDNPCCAYIGQGGAGHFVKMVHNGIEYAEMQLLAELYSLLTKSVNYNEIANIFKTWNNGELASYLLEITIEILKHKSEDKYTLDTILDKAGNKGTGSWSSKAAFDLGVPNTMMATSVFARYLSSLKIERVTYSKQIDKQLATSEKIDVNSLKDAYKTARIINHAQGFNLIKQASKEYNWNLNLSEIARIWTNGCIIRSQLMNDVIDIFKLSDNLLDNSDTFNTISAHEKCLKELIKTGLNYRVSLHAFSAAYYYWLDMTTEKLPANIIQAQRDYFGAHTYQKIGDSSKSFYHTDWNKNG